ncbi:S-layer homology domain-containing protein [Pseudoflavonifractor phocaeensis]|uniref:S-layer homology domain-containing protein n=1 Tax=Pseudoflavonifractor phocaeensis TaxID=1870988 RepID=UPI0019584638|nr:S-layer homology domain-containing protein [Pseudoflavonifractor phocaeensis]MBM6924339.1 S-layer homology domain-containing protein [Pseudoflavonifractor phocaeensis]
MKKRFLSVLLAAALALGLASAALAAELTETESAQLLAALDIMVGDDKGDLALDRTITRAEFTKMAVAASTSRDTVGDTVTVKPYPDVPQTHWAASYIKVATDMGLVQGDLSGLFNPDREITLAEGVTMVLRLLGYEDGDFAGTWPAGQMAQYRALELDEGIACGQNDSMTRQDAQTLFTNLMFTKTKAGAYYLNVLEPDRDLVTADGDFDRMALINSDMEGPLVAGRGWEASIPFDLEDAVIYRNGKVSMADAIQTQDVLYYSEIVRTVWAYSDKVTGLLEGRSPSASSPTSVTVAGRTYAIESMEAAYALSDLGGYAIGDTVTLLLGRDGGVAAVGSAEEQEALLYGVITAVEDRTYDDGDGGSYTARSVSMTATDGNTYWYAVSDTYLDEGDMVQVVQSSGGVSVTRLSNTRIEGRVNSDGSKIGLKTVAADVQIIDTYEACTPLRIYPSRLAGMTLTKDMVRFYALNEQGEISHLILNDATGDIHQYGILTTCDEQEILQPNGDLTLTGTYVYDIGGQRTTLVVPDTIYRLKVGPCQVVLESDTEVDRPYNLTERKLNSVSDTFAVGTNNQTYKLSQSVVVYLYQNGIYRISDLQHILNGEYTLTGWYDKEQKDGGRIRVIVARPVT